MLVKPLEHDMAHRKHYINICKIKKMNINKTQYRS